MNILHQKYHNEVKKNLLQKFKYKTPMQIPRIEKIILNMTAGKEVTNSKAIEEVERDLKLIAGQKPVQTVAKNSLATWKLREGMPMGSKVTLRREKMWNFLDKLINIVIPRIRDFRGISPESFDGHGNFAMGINEHIIFPEIDFDKIRSIRGLDVIIVTSAPTNDEARTLLKFLGLPFKDMKA